MFTTTHDLILLAIAALYVALSGARVFLLGSALSGGSKIAPGRTGVVVAVLTMPLLIATALFITAVLW